MPPPLTKSQIERLGQRLVAAGEPASEDVAALHELLRAYAVVLDDAANRLRAATALAPTSRVKNTGTILEKLRRYGGSWLKSIQDLAGMRVVGAFDRNGQDELVRAVVALFSDAPRPPKVIDRRNSPVNGYRAVHVVVFPDSVPVEIQVRTELQHEWAELFEKLADLVGRDIRYGEPPSHWLSAEQRSELDAEGRDLYELAYRTSEGSVESAILLAESIASFEEAEQAFPNASELPKVRSAVTGLLSTLREVLGQFETADTQAKRHLRPESYD